MLQSARPRRIRSTPSIAATAVALAVALLTSGCTARAECAPDAESRTVTVHVVKPGVGAVQCWSGCEADAGELDPAGAADVWTAHLAADRPESMTLAARDASGALLFAQRYRLRWSGCPATPSPDEFELFRPEGGS